MCALAEEKGYQLSQVFIEAEDGSSSAYAALIDALRTTDISTVLVPSLNHFGHLPSLSAVMIQRIEEETGKQIVIVPIGDG